MVRQIDPPEPFPNDMSEDDLRAGQGREPHVVERPEPEPEVQGEAVDQPSLPYVPTPSSLLSLPASDRTRINVARQGRVIE